VPSLAEMTEAVARAVIKPAMSVISVRALGPES
jgi:hypothetical protein